MKKLSSVTISGGLTVDQATTLSGVVSVGGIGTGAYTSVLVRNSSNQMLYRTFSDFLNDISGSLNLSGYVPTSRTLTINGTTYDLSANRTWTITTPYVSKLQHAVKAGVAINKGQAVYVTSADGTNMIVGLASNASEATSSKTMGLLDATVSTNGFANVVTEGLLAGLDTSTANAEGDPVWLGTGGNLIYGLGSKPYAPAHLVFIGIVTRKNANNGEIFVKVQNGFELKEIHDVDLITSAPTAGQLLRYESDGLWKNWSPNYLTAEADTLQSVTNRGSSTSTDISIGGAGGDRGLRINHGSGVGHYGRIRFYQDSSNISTIHSFSTTWQNGDVFTSTGAINITGDTGVTFGSWNVPDVVFRLGGISYFRNNVGIGTTSPGSKLSVFGNNDVFSVISQTADTSFATRLLAQYVGLFNNGANGHHLYVSSSQELGPAEFNLTKTWGGFLTFGVSGDGTARTRALYVNSNGYVGVNVNPISGDRFEVAGSVRIHTGNNWDAIQIYSDGANGYIQGLGDETGLRIRSEYGNILLADNRGNVGIGVTNPAAKLHVVETSNSATTYPLIINNQNNQVGDGWGAGIKFSTSNPLGGGNEGLKWSSIQAFDVNNYGSSSGLSFTVSHTYNKNTAMVINRYGDVGINTTSPSAKLDVNGSIYAVGEVAIRQSGSSALSLYRSNSGYQSITHYWEGAGLYWAVGMGYGTYSWVINDTNYGVNNKFVVTQGSTWGVGIGTASPGAKLTVYSDTTTDGIVIDVLSRPRITLRDRGNSDTIIGTGDYGLDDFFIDTYSGNALAIKGSTRNVGIGTTSPDTPLVVQGGSAGTGGWNRTATLSATYPGLIFNSNGTKWGGMAYDYSAAMRFWVNASNNDIFAGTLAMSILNNGNVGIGTSDPGAKLHVVGNAWINRPSNKVDNASCTELPSRVEFNNAFASGASGYTVFTYPTPSVFRIYGDYDGNIGGLQPDLQLGLGYLTVKNSGGTMGNVGIGTTSPAAKLHVVGNTYIQSGALFVDTIGGYTTNLISLAASTNVLVPSGDITIGSGASTGSSQPFGDFSQLKFDNLHSDTNRGPNKIVMHDNGSAWIGGFGIHSDTVSYYTGGHHRWYKTDSQTSSNQVMQLDASGNLSITGTFSASGYNNSNWNTAYGWGNHASAGYLTSETDTLASVTARGSSTSTAVTFNGGVNLAANTGIRKAGDNWIIGYDTSLPGIAIGSGTVTDKVSISSGGTQRVWFDTNGKVGIGTSTPAEELHVIGRGIFNGGSGDSSTDAVVYITKSNNNDWGLYVNASGLDYGMYTRVSPSAGYAIGVNNGTNWTTRITGDGRIYLSEKDTIASYDTWLRLNESGHYGSGVYTPGVMRADGGFYVSGSQVWHAGNDGSGSGLDADLLDGQNSTEFLRLLSGGAEASLDSYTDNGFRSVSFPGHSQHLLSWNAGGSTGTVQQLFHYGTPNNGWRIRNKTDNSSWSDWGYVVMASSNQGLISGTIATQSWVGSQSYATTSYVTTQINNLINGAPGVLDTLDELAAALGDDANFATTVTNSIAGKVSKSGDTMTSSGQQVLNIFHGAATGDFNDALFVKNTVSEQQVQIGMATTGSDGDHHRVSLRAYKGAQALEGVFGIALRQPGSAAHTQRLTLDYLGNLTIGGFLTESSSLKLKENVETSEGNLEKVVNLRPVTFNKIGSQTTELGLIAEEVAEVYPEFVQYDENGEPIGVNYSRLTAALIGAVKELTNQVQELNKKING